MSRLKHRQRSFLLAVAATILAAFVTSSPLMAFETVPQSDEPLRIESSQGLLLRLDRPASAVFVANPDIADIQVKSPRLIYILGKKAGETTLYAVDAEERVLANRKIAVSHNLSRLREALKVVAPQAGIEANSVENNIVLSGNVQSPAEAENVRRIAAALVSDPSHVVNVIGINAPTQVHLRVRVTEVSREVLKQFGINWDAVFSSGKFLFGLATGAPVAMAGAFRTNAFSASVNTSRLDLNGLIDALDDEGLISILAEPNLTAVSGKPANFLAGGEFPIIVPDDGRVNVVFKQFGVSLAFTPTVLGSDRISLHVNPEVSQLSNAGAVEIAGFSIPALTTRRAETTVELGNGQSFAIAGLLQNNITHDLGKFPGLGDVPVLGTLFRSDRFRRRESELVIIVTPYIVRPVSAAQIASPTDGLRPPTDTDRILRGQMHQPHAERGNSAPVVGGIHGPTAPVGFALD